MPDIEAVRIPDEILFALSRMLERLPKIATFNHDDGSTTLRSLRKDEQLALHFMTVPNLVSEIIENINIVMADLEALGANARTFGDLHPYRRYKLLARTFVYEFGRFEDAFSYFTLWLQKDGHIDKATRRELRDHFYKQIEPMVKIRNACLHDDVNWKSTTPEIGILGGLDLFRMQVKDKDGQLLTWEKHLGPVCEKQRQLIYEVTAPMRTMWNMLFAQAVERLIEKGKLKKAKRPFKPKNMTYPGTRERAS